MFTLRHIILCLFLIFGICNVNCEEPQIQIKSTQVNCYGGKDGKVEISWLSDQPDSFKLSLLNNSVRLIRTYTQKSVFPVKVNNLKAGNYQAQLEYASKLQKFDFIVESPAELTASGIYIAKLHINSTDTLADLKAEYYGGTPPYSITWSNETGSQIGEIALEIPFGIYKYLLNDNNNCGPVSATFFFDKEELVKFNKQK